jgi:membrane protease YdiL (CAAX protease family)
VTTPAGSLAGSYGAGAGWRDFARLVAGLALVFAGFQWVATVLASDRGQAGLPIALLVVAALLVVERILFGQPFAAAARALGLGVPARRGLLTAAALGLLLLLVIPVYAHFARAPVALHPGWPCLLAGLFAQAGIAEETLFRGYLFGHLRRRHPFWRAASLSMIPFVIVHLLMFVSLPWPIAAAAMLLAVVLSFPLAHLFELGGGTIWAPALVHFVVQGALKVGGVSAASPVALPLVWMAASATIPWLAFLVPRRPAA